MDEERINAKSAKAVKEAARKERRADDQVDNDLRELLALPAGRRFLARLLFDECCLMDTSYHTSGQTFALNEGRRGVAVQLQAELIRASPEGYLALLRERIVKSAV